MKSDACSGMNTRITALENAGGGGNCHIKYGFLARSSSASITTSFVPRVFIIYEDTTTTSSSKTGILIYNTNIAGERSMYLYNTYNPSTVTAVFWGSVAFGNNGLSIRGTGKGGQDPFNAAWYIVLG